MPVTKYPFANIVSLMPDDVVVTAPDGSEHTIPKAATGVTIPTISYTSDDLGAWKIDADSNDPNYIYMRKRTGKKKTNNLPDPVAGKVYLVPSDVCAVARKLEDRTDVITPADFIRARYRTNDYVYFGT